MVDSHLILLLGIIFLLVFIFGRLLEKIHIPGIFVALLLGLSSSFIPFVQESIQYDGFKMLSFLGMSFLLFLIGFEIDIEKIKKLGKFIVKSSFLIILGEAITLGLLIYLIFGLPIVVSILVGLSFATVGEAILIPILDTLNITKTNLGQTILGVATMDDIFEVFSIITGIALLPILIHSNNTGISTINNIIIPITLGIIIIKLVKKSEQFKKSLIKHRFFFSIVIFFLFIGLGTIGDISAIGAIMGGIVASNIIKKKDLPLIKNQIKNIAYYLLGPIFFFAIGTDIDLHSFKNYYLLIILFSTIPYIIKIFISYLNGKRTLGTHKSIYMGISLGVRFSTSIIMLTIFLNKKVIPQELFSILISTTIFSSLLLPILLSFLAKKRNIGLPQKTIIKNKVVIKK